MITNKWQTPSYSKGGSGNCVRACASDDMSAVYMGDTQNPSAAPLSVTPGAWSDLLRVAATDPV
jgi:hypothetical protein